MILPPGETLGGFRVIEALGVGGMAVVYRAEQVSLHREVALKVLSPELGTDEVFCERFRREGMHVSRLDHPNIIPIYDAGADRDRLFLAMRLVDGMTLAERIRVQPLTATEVLSILEPIADALDCAHAAGIIHRDVKPQNILLTERGHPYLTDFGVAKNVDTAAMTDAGQFIGSVRYAAPEQILSTPTSAATDVYALTVVLYQCLTGTVPHAGKADAGALFAHLNEPPPRVELAEAQAFNRVVEHGMAHDPSDRYQSTSELIEAAREGLARLSPFHLRRRPAFSPAVVSTDTPQDAATAVTPARVRWRPSRRLGTAVIALAALAGLVIGLILIGGRPAVASSRTARSGGLAVSYRSPWTLAHDAFASSAVTSGGAAAQPPIELRSSQATMAAGALRASAPIPGGPPPALVSAYGHPAVSQGRLADGVAVATYAWRLAGGRSVTAWIIPAEAGDLGVICSAPTTSRASQNQCAAMATHVGVSSGLPVLPLGPDVSVADSLRSATSGAIAARHSLAAHKGSWPVRTVTSAASADEQAAAKLRRLRVPARYEHTVSVLAASFAAEAHALDSLAHAVQGKDQAGYHLGFQPLAQAERRLDAALRVAQGAEIWTVALGRLAAPAWHGGSTSVNGPSGGTPPPTNGPVQPNKIVYNAPNPPVVSTAGSGATPPNPPASAQTTTTATTTSPIDLHGSTSGQPGP